MKKKRGLTVVVAVVLIGIVAVVSLGLGAEKDEPVSVQQVTAIKVETLLPTKGNLTRNTQYIGRVEPGQQVAVIPRTMGEVIAIHYDVGDTVQKGALLFEMDTYDIQLQVDIAQAAYDSAKAQVDQGLDSGVDAQLLQLEAAYNQAKLAYENAVKLADMGEDSMEDQLDSLRDTYTGLSGMITEAKGLAEAKGIEVATAQAKYEAIYGPGGVADQLKDVTNDIKQMIGSGPAPNPGDNGYGEYIALKQLQDGLQGQMDNASSEAVMLKEIQQLKDELNGYTASVKELQSGYNTASNGYDQIVDNRGLSRAQTNAQVAQARVAMESAEKALNLAREKSIPQGEVSALAGLRQAEASLIAARRNLEFAQVTAPISGVIEMKNVALNNFATSSNAAYVISNKDMMQVSFAVPESVLHNLSIGDAVTVERSGQTATGEITELSTMVGSTGGLFTVKASLPSSSLNLLTGTTVTLEVETARAVDSLLLPVDCVYYESNQPYIYVNEGGFAKRVDVVTGLHDSDYIEIVSGISAGDQIVATWHSRLTDGAELSISDGAAG